MKIEFVNGFLPMIIFETKSDKFIKSYFFLSFLKNLNDEIELEHEKAIVEHNYAVTITTILMTLLTYQVSIYLFTILMLIIVPILTILYWSNVGEYHRDVKAYATSAKIKAKQDSISIDEAIDYYKNIIIQSPKYGDFVKSINPEKVLSDLRHNL